MDCDIHSCENAGKSLVNRFPALSTKFAFTELDGRLFATKRRSFVNDLHGNRQKLRLAAFVEDKRTGVVYQAAHTPSRSSANPLPPKDSTIKVDFQAR